MIEFAGLAALITAVVGVWKFFDERQAKKNGLALNQISNKIDNLESKYEKGQQEDRMAIMRLEIMALMRDDPDNVAQIEKVARAYFSQGGDWYLTGVYSKWAKAHNGDISICADID